MSSSSSTENVSFDHYFGTYPKAPNTDGTKFVAKPGTPKVNGLTQITSSGRRPAAHTTPTSTTRSGFPAPGR